MMRVLACLFVVGAAAFAQEIEALRPACGAPGDYVLICGSDFADEPSVSFGDVEADVVKSARGAGKVLVRVPEGLEAGDVTISVDGAEADFSVLAEDAPVVAHLSASVANPGNILVLIGDRLEDGSVDFLDGDGAVAASTDLVGGVRVAYLQVPAALEPGTYTLRVSNAAGDSGACSPELEVREPGDPTIESIEPEAQQPGRSVRIQGTDLGPIGLAFVNWTLGDETLTTLGFADGFENVFTHVPFDADGGETYDVVVSFSDGATTEPFAYEVGELPDPEIDELAPDTGPAGTTVRIRGVGLFGALFGGGGGVALPPGRGPTGGGNGLFGIAQGLPFKGGGGLPTVEFTRDGEATEAFVLFAAPGFGDENDTVVCRVPNVEDGDYDVTVTVGSKTSNAVVFTVQELPLSVTAIRPDGQGPKGPNRPVLIEGTGFGAFDGFGGFGDPQVEVDFEDADGETHEAFVLFHNDREILLIPPGGWFDPLEPGEYNVRVTRDPGGDDEESVEAGTYTVRDS